MDLKEQLLQNEVQYMGQIIQTLSFELVVLQDFIAEEFGPRFQAYREKYSPKEVSGTSKIIQPSSSNAGKLRRAQKYNSGETVVGPASAKLEVELREIESTEIDNTDITDAEINESNFGVGNESPRSNTRSVDPLEDSELNSDSEHNGRSRGSDSIEHLKHPMDDRDGTKKGGRKKMKIWMYFDKIDLDNDKVAARCQNCQGMVSSRACRMIEHHLKCTQMKSSRRKTSSGGRSRDYATEIRNEMKKMKKEQNPPNVLETNSNSRIVSKEGSEIVSSPRKCGKPQDTIWSYYTVVEIQGLKKAKCKACGDYISPKADRLRHHKITCEEVGNTGNNENSEGIEDKESDVNTST